MSAHASRHGDCPCRFGRLFCIYHALLLSEPGWAHGEKRLNPENVAAIKNWFLKLFVYHQLLQEDRDLELCDCFDRQHFIVSTFERAMSLLEKYKPSDFHIPLLYAYVISSLSKNVPMVEEVASDQEHYMRINCLAAKYNVWIYLNQYMHLSCSEPLVWVNSFTLFCLYPLRHSNTSNTQFNKPKKKESGNNVHQSRPVTFQKILHLKLHKKFLASLRLNSILPERGGIICIKFNNFLKFLNQFCIL